MYLQIPDTGQGTNKGRQNTNWFNCVYNEGGAVVSWFKRSSLTAFYGISRNLSLSVHPAVNGYSVAFRAGESEVGEEEE